MKLKIIILSATLVGAFIFGACKKNTNDNRSARLTVKMIDAPGDYQQVNVEVLQVKVKHENNGWIDLPTVSGVYDLLTLQNDVSATLVHGGVLPAGKINQLRLVLGNNNTIMVDSVLYDLATPSAQMSGLKINLNHRFMPDQAYQLILDFEAESSIVEQGNGEYSLKPVIKVDAIFPI